MKTTITVELDPSINAMLSKKYDVDRIVRAVNGAANQPGAIALGEVKRGAVSGGNTYRADGTLTVKDHSMRTTQAAVLTYGVSAKTGINVPIEFLKWNDSLSAHFRKTGRPSGDLSPDLIPVHLTEWLGKFKKGIKSPAKNEAKSPAQKVTLPAPARATTPAPGLVQNGNGAK